MNIKQLLDSLCRNKFIDTFVKFHLWIDLAIVLLWMGSPIEVTFLFSGGSTGNRWDVRNFELCLLDRYNSGLHQLSTYL